MEKSFRSFCSPNFHSTASSTKIITSPSKMLQKFRNILLSTRPSLTWTWKKTQSRIFASIKSSIRKAKWHILTSWRTKRLNFALKEEAQGTVSRLTDPSFLVLLYKKNIFFYIWNWNKNPQKNRKMINYFKKQFLTENSSNASFN